MIISGKTLKVIFFQWIENILANDWVERIHVIDYKTELQTGKAEFRFEIILKQSKSC